MISQNLPEKNEIFSILQLTYTPSELPNRVMSYFETISKASSPSVTYQIVCKRYTRLLIIFSYPDSLIAGFQVISGIPYL